MGKISPLNCVIFNRKYFMRTLGNIIWNIPFLGFVTAALVFLIGLLFVVTIIAAPIGLGLIQYSKFLLLPFSYDMVSKSEIEGDADKNILWQTYGFILRKLCKIRNFSQSPFGGFIFEESDGNFPSGRN